MSETLNRNADWITREYDKEKWAAILGQVEALIEGGESNAKRILSLVSRAVRDCPAHTPIDTVHLGRAVEACSAYAWGGNYALIADAVIDACSAETGAIVELGSGFGRNLFEVWFAGGPRRSKYYGCEYTYSGVTCTQRLASLVPEMRLEARRFDYYHPDLSHIGQGHKHAVVFSVRSVEQIPHIGEDVFGAICRIAERVTVLHFEPVGWQLPAHLSQGMVGSSRAYAEKNDYNRNLWNVLTQLQSTGQITLEEVIPEIVTVNPRNCMSLIRWRKTP